MDIVLDAPIIGVTVYPERALVVRRGTATIEAPGEHILRVSGLPQSTVQSNSLRATGSGPAGTRILGIEQASEFHAAPPEETLSRLRDEIARLKGEMTLVDDRVQILEEQRGWLRNLGEQAARSIAYGISRGTTRAEEAGNVAGSIFAYSSQEAERLAAAKIELDRRRDELQRELEARARELGELGGGKPPDRIAAIVRISITTPGTVEIQLSYLVSGAMWRPRYDARVDIASQRVRLTQQAIVNQRTGEGWAQVALAVSTAQPSAAVSLPDEPDPWYLDILKPPPPPTPMVAGAASPMRMARMVAAGEGRERGVTDTTLYSSGTQLQQQVEAEIAGATAERSGVAQIFHLPGRSDVPSDGMPRTLGIGDYDLPCRLDYVTAPVLASGAHLRATASNTTGQVLLPGELHIFHAGPAGDEYVGATTLDLTAENADLKLYLGVDDNITVKRELIERDTDKGSILQGGVRRITIGYRVTLSNRTGSPQRIVLKDRLPVPRNERIKLRVLDMRPQPSAHTKLEQLTWEMQLAPNEERRIEWRFVVESPADIEMIGLPA